MLNERGIHWRMKFNIKRILWLLSIIALAQTLLIDCRSPEFKSQWIDKAINIDGQENDWKTIPLYRLESWSSALGLCNDSEYFYIFLKIENPLLAMNLYTNGITLKFALQSEGQSIFAMCYVGSDTLDPLEEPGDSFWQCLNSEQKKRFMTNQVLEKNKITVLKHGHTMKIPSDGTQGIAAARVFNPRFLGYEFKIPKQPGKNTTNFLDVDFGNSFFVGMSFKEHESEVESAIRRPTYGMMGENGMIGRQPMDNSREFRSDRFSIPDQEVWFKITLADHK